MHRAKIPRSLSLASLRCSPVSPASLRSLPPPPSPLMSTTFKRVHFPPLRPHPRRAGNVNISLLAPRASSPRVHVYNGGNCAEFQPLKCVGRARQRQGGGGREGVHRKVRAGMHVSLVTLRSARARRNGGAYRRRLPAAYDDECRPYCRRV